MKKSEQSERTRGRLIEAATHLFAKKGYRDTSVHAIGEAAGISRGSIFWHFGSKDGLLLAVVERVFAEWESGSLVSDVGGGTGAEAVRRALGSHRSFLQHNREICRLFFVLMFEGLGPRPELAREFARLHRGLRRLAADWIDEGIEAGELRSDLDPQGVATSVIGALGGIAYQWLLDPARVNLDRAYEGLAATLTRGL